ncbi:hypothetical protein M422DRAFT_41170 [Sphaerobolus stellatus SS14]|nr:hypothetical protein M422DRAFT_41170 [Sphaerobolus stellatus SS14]
MPLVLRCVICLDVLSDSKREPHSTPCGHVYCSHCITRLSKTRQDTNCAVCRFSFPITNVIKLYFDEAPVSREVTPLRDDQKLKLKETVASCNKMHKDVSQTEVEQTLMRAEKLAVELYQSHRDTGVEHLLKDLTDSLESLRKRLGLFSRVNALQGEVESLKEERDSLKKIVKDASKDASKSIRDQEKMSRRFERATAELQVQLANELKAQRMSSAEIQQLNEELDKQKLRSARYEKKYHTAAQELKALKTVAASIKTMQTERARRSVADNSLEILPPARGVSSDLNRAATRRPQAKPNLNQTRPVKTHGGA